MLKKIGIIVAVLLAALVVAVLTRPSAFHIARAAAINAPPAVAYAQVADFHRWEAWSPWAKLDPAMKTTYSGAPAGTGAVYAWAGNDQVGEGRMTILEARPGEQLTIQLQFLKPFAATNLTTFTFAPRAGGTELTWAMEGQNDFLGKAYSLFVNMDKMVGGDFEKGLASLKAVAEAEAQKSASQAPPPAAPVAAPGPARSAPGTAPR